MTRNKKGFTLVELVIVIAVIAILAGVMVAVFSGVVKRANESAELQKIKNEELAQKADDILKKVDNSNWFSWEDFENSLAAKLTATYEKYASMNNGPTSDQIKGAVKDALEEYGKNIGAENTSLTEAQVKAIVENALAKASLGGVTEAQVRTIVNTAVAGVNGVTKAQVQSIVDAAVAKGLTAAQVAQIIVDADLATAAQAGTLQATVNTLTQTLATVQANALTKEDVEAMIKKLLPVTDTVETVDEFNDAVATWNSGSTIVVAEALKGTALTITTNDVKELNIKGLDDTSNVTVNAPYATINFITDVGVITVKDTAMQSVHIFGKVLSLIINKGRAVIEEGASVGTLDIAAKADVVVDIEKSAEVTGTLTVKETTGTVEVNNKGTVDAVAAESTDAGKAVFNNVDEGKITNTASADTANGVTDNHIVIFDNEGNNENIEVVKTLDELLAALTAKKAYIKLGADITTVASTDKLINITYSMTLDGDGHTIDGPGGWRSNLAQHLICIGYGLDQEHRIKSVVIKNINFTSTSVLRPLECRGFTDAITFENVKLDMTKVTKSGYHQGFTYGGYEDKVMTLTVRNCDFAVKQGTSAYTFILFNPVEMNVENTKIAGWAGLYFKDGSEGSTVNLNNSALECVNYQSGTSNDFGAIVFEDRNIKVILANTYIDASETGTAEQYAILFSEYWAEYFGNDLTDVAVYVKEGTTIKGRIVLESEDTSNVAYIEGGTFEQDPTDWVAAGHTVKQEGDYYVVD